jgi:hypothetical protein
MLNDNQVVAFDEFETSLVTSLLDGSYRSTYLLEHEIGFQTILEKLKPLSIEPKYSLNI